MFRGELIIGAVLGFAAGFGAISSQTDWLDTPEVIACDYEWTPLTEDPARTHEMSVNQWWELEYGNDPEIPDDIEEASIIAGLRYSTAPEIYQAMSERESHHDTQAENGEYKGAWQVSERWHAGRIAELGLDGSDLFDPYCAALVAADYLNELVEKYEGDMALALMAYNGDATGIKRYYKTGKVSQYAQWILDRSEELERLHGK